MAASFQIKSQKLRSEINNLNARTGAISRSGRGPRGLGWPFPSCVALGPERSDAAKKHVFLLFSRAPCLYWTVWTGETGRAADRQTSIKGGSNGHDELEFQCHSLSWFSQSLSPNSLFLLLLLCLLFQSALTKTFVLVAVIANLGPAGTAFGSYVWPSSYDEIEDIYSLQQGYEARLLGDSKSFYH